MPDCRSGSASAVKLVVDVGCADEVTPPGAVVPPPAKRTMPPAASAATPTAAVATVTRARESLGRRVVGVGEGGAA